MIKNFSIIFLVLVIATSCRKKKSEEEAVYDLPIPRSQMVNVLTDIYMAEASLIEYTSDKQDSMRKLFTTEIFTIHQIDKNYFDSIQQILSQNIPLFTDVHNEVLDSINKPSDE